MKTTEAAVSVASNVATAMAFTHRRNHVLKVGGDQRQDVGKGSILIFATKCVGIYAYAMPRTQSR